MHIYKAMHLNGNATSVEGRTLMWIPLVPWVISLPQFAFNSIIYWEKILEISKSMCYYLKLGGT
jgi:hypothetical protein